MAMIPFRRSKTTDAASTLTRGLSPFRRSKTTTKTGDKFRRSDTTSSTVSSSEPPSEADLCEYGDMGMNDRSERSSTLPDRRRGGVLFKESSKYNLHAVRFMEPKKSILKVATVEDSLRSCQLHKEKETRVAQRPSLNLEVLSTSLRALLLPEPRGCKSCGHGMDLHDASEDTSVTWPDSTNDSESFPPREPKVQFTNIHSRLYPASADDNPSASGKGPAIALHGWFFHTEQDISIDDYEANREPRRKMEELKIDVLERRRRLLAAGVSSAEIQELSARRNRAKIQRMQTMQAFSINGPGYMEKLERRERFGRYLGRKFGLRKTNSKGQAALWDLAQDELPAVRLAKPSTTTSLSIRRFSE